MSMKQCMVPCPVVLKANLEPGESRMCVHGNCVITVCHDESCFINLSTAHRVKDGIIVPRPAVPTEIGILEGEREIPQSKLECSKLVW